VNGPGNGAARNIPRRNDKKRFETLLDKQTENEAQPASCTREYLQNRRRYAKLLSHLFVAEKKPARHDKFLNYNLIFFS
jgi:hypothetical protein